MKCERRGLFPLPYPLRLGYRALLFAAALICWIIDPRLLDVKQSAIVPVPALLICLAMTLNMIAQHFHLPDMSRARLKQYPAFCDIDPGYDPAQLKAEVRRQDRGAAKVALLWLTANGVIAVLYLRSVIGAAELMLLGSFYYLSDMICILFFCPFQLFLMGNRCCINCRIYSWGAWMMAVPLSLIPSPATLLPVLLALSLLLRWEFRYRRHPERFWSGSNRALRCFECRDHLCRTKPIPTPGFRREGR